MTCVLSKVLTENYIPGHTWEMTGFKGERKVSNINSITSTDLVFFVDVTRMATEGIGYVFTSLISKCFCDGVKT